MLSHYDMLGGTGDHRSGGHRHLRNYHDDVFIEHFVEILDDSSRSFCPASRGVKNKIKATSPWQVVHYGHEAVHIKISDSALRVISTVRSTFL